MQRVLDFRFILLYVQYVYKLIEDFTIKNETHSMTAIESYLQKSDRSFENNYLDPVYVVHCLFLTEKAWSHGGPRSREFGQTPSNISMGD